MRETSHFHRAINGWRHSAYWHGYRGRPAEPPFGKARTIEERTTRGSRPIQVRCLDVSHPYSASSTCRIQNDRWHNRIHHARVRWIATDPTNGQVFELGQTYCGRTLSNPLYFDLPTRDCGCTNGPASMCPLCELAFHPAGLAGACDALRLDLQRLPA